MQNNDVTTIYNELLTSKSVTLPDDFTDEDVDVLCHIIQNKMKREYPLMLFQRADRLLYVI